MSRSIASFARSEIVDLTPYESARSLVTEGTVFLDANESPVSPVISGYSNLNRYPEPQPRSLLERFSSIYNVEIDQLMIGRGADEAIDLLVRTFCEPGRDKILICPPTYGMYDISAKIQGAQTIRVPLVCDSGDFTLDINGISEALTQDPRIKILFLCSPNNPTGTAFDSTVLSRICKICEDRCVVVIDEAYAEFQEGPAMVKAVSRFPHLVVLKTLSKAWALAGARCGITIAQKATIDLLQKIRPPYPLSTPSVQVILEATDLKYQNLLKERIAKNRNQRERLREALLETGRVETIYPSSANFILVKFRKSSGMNKDGIFNFLKSRGIILRDRSKDHDLEGCIRITIGTEEENQILLNVLQTYFGKNLI